MLEQRCAMGYIPLSATRLILLLPKSQTSKDWNVSSKTMPYGWLKRAISPIPSMLPVFFEPARVETSPVQQRYYWMEKRCMYTLGSNFSNWVVVLVRNKESACFLINCNAIRIIKLCICPCPILVSSTATASKYTDNSYDIFSEENSRKEEK